MGLKKVVVPDHRGFSPTSLVSLALVAFICVVAVRNNILLDDVSSDGHQQRSPDKQKHQVSHQRNNHKQPQDYGEEFDAFEEDEFDVPRVNKRFNQQKSNKRRNVRMVRGGFDR